ncbi:MAG TPA: hypothetical protein VFS21_03020 [Roseiflexaceae bacterium]|nr:hypothetical protein [Roseiflexaceae bacterium]
MSAVEVAQVAPADREAIEAELREALAAPPALVLTITAIGVGEQPRGAPAGTLTLGSGRQGVIYLVKKREEWPTE